MSCNGIWPGLPCKSGGSAPLFCASSGVAGGLQGSGMVGCNGQLPLKCKLKRLAC